MDEHEEDKAKKRDAGCGGIEHLEAEAIHELEAEGRCDS